MNIIPILFHLGTTPGSVGGLHLAQVLENGSQRCLSVLLEIEPRILACKTPALPFELSPGP